MVSYYQCVSKINRTKEYIIQKVTKGNNMLDNK